MVNGGTITGLLSEQRGALGLIAVVATTMAGALGAGLSAYYQAQSRAYTDTQIEQVIEDRLLPRMDARRDLTDFRYMQAIERLLKIEGEIAKNTDQFQRIWAAIAERPDRQALSAFNLEDDRRLERLERGLESLQRVVYGTRSSPNP